MSQSVRPEVPRATSGRLRPRFLEGAQLQVMHRVVQGRPPGGLLFWPFYAIYLIMKSRIGAVLIILAAVGLGFCFYT